MVVGLLVPVNTREHLRLYPALGLSKNHGVIVSLTLIAIEILLGIVANSHMP